MKACCLTVLAKAPVAGVAKTRLMPALGAAGAAALAERLLDHTLQEAAAANMASLRLLGSPDASHPALVRHAGVAELGAQCSGDLGARMQQALVDGLARQPSALLIGTDAPALDRHCLREAADALLNHDAVFVPALDGGYALVGLSRRLGSVPDALFRDMTWSTASVMAETRQRLNQLACRWVELPAVADIDEPADLVHVPRGWLP
jgi:rSAM/selenodomain-associated transferase 1